MHRNLGLNPVQSPCKGCDKRAVGCHADCAAYRAFRADADAFKAGKYETIVRAGKTASFKRRQLAADRDRREGRLHY